jgi:RNA polymerase-binding transcription factor DksA
MAEKTRYSDEELEEFRTLINQKLDVARQELEVYRKQILKKDDFSEGEEDHKFNSMEEGSLHTEKEYLNQMASKQSTFIQNLEKALMRINNKTYGICKDSGKLISKERLIAVPHATQTIEAKNLRDSQK